MRNYIPKNDRELKNVYKQVNFKLADYNRLKREREDIIHSSPGPADGMPRGSDTSNPTQQKALKLADIDNFFHIVGQACMAIRGEYSTKVQEDFDPVKAYWDYDYFNYKHIRICSDDTGPSYSTWKRYKSKLQKLIAVKLNLI